MMKRNALFYGAVLQISFKSSLCLCHAGLFLTQQLILSATLPGLVNTISVCSWNRTACLTRPPTPKPPLRASTPQTHSSAKQTNFCMQSYTRKVIDTISHTHTHSAQASARLQELYTSQRTIACYASSSGTQDAEGTVNKKKKKLTRITRHILVTRVRETC